MSSDLINRQEVLESFRRICYLCGKREEYDGVMCRACSFDDAIDIVENLSPAEPERKKGKWVEVGGYVTPGGDPVWCCSECGKGIHVYGIEAITYNSNFTDGHQWVACPNCGADMRE